MAGPLEGLCVVDTSERSVAAAVAGMLLGDLGACVVRVEPPGGDGLRGLDGHRVWFRGQRSVTVGPGLGGDSGWGAVRDRADVVIGSVQPRRGLPDLVGGWRPGPGQVLAVLTAVPRGVRGAAGVGGVGQAVYGELVEAQCGLLDEQLGFREGPVFLGWPLAAYGAAWLLAIGVLAAVWDPATGVDGQIVTTSLLDGVAFMEVLQWTGGPGLPVLPGRRPVGGVGGAEPRSNARSVISLLECGDGEWVFVHTFARGAFDRLMRLVGREDLVDASITSGFFQLDPGVAAGMWESVRAAFASGSAQYWFEVLAEADVPCMVANPAGRALLVEQYDLNGLIARGPNGRVELGSVVKYGRTPVRVRTEVPSAGSSSGAGVVKELGPVRERRRVAVRGGAAELAGRGPLGGLLVLDFGVFLAGPFASRLMADLGARVIKVEEKSGDPFRAPVGGFLNAGRGKESLAVDLKDPRGRSLVYELVGAADVVHSNMRLGALERLGVDYESLRAVNPRLVYCHSSGYGNDGPWSRLPTFEPLHSASTGVLHRTGGRGNRPLMYLSNLDLGCGMTSLICVLGALVERERSGQGQFLEVPQTGAGLLAMSDAYLEDGVVHETFPLDGAQRGHSLANSLYATSDGWVLVCAYDAIEWEGVRRALGAAEEDWPEFARAVATLPGEGGEAARLDELFGGLSSLAAVAALEACGVPCTIPTRLDRSRLAVDPLLRELGVMVVEDQADYGPIFEPGHGVRFSVSAAQHARPAPAVGQHSRAILAELGRSEAEVDELVAAGVVVAGSAGAGVGGGGGVLLRRGRGGW